MPYKNLASPLILVCLKKSHMFRDSDEVVLAFCKILIFYVSTYILEAKLCRVQFRSFESDL